jgi:hypothetical protein
LILRWQHLLSEHADASGYVLPDEILVTSIVYNPVFPDWITDIQNWQEVNFEAGPGE